MRFQLIYSIGDQSQWIDNTITAEKCCHIIWDKMVLNYKHWIFFQEKINYLSNYIFKY